MDQRQHRSRSSLCVVVSVLVSVVAALSGCGGAIPRRSVAVTAPAGSSATASTSSATPNWRMAYVGQGNLLHFITLDGASDETGANVVGLDMYGLNAFGAISPDGRYLLISANGTAIMDFSHSGKHVVTVSGDYTRDVYWSPDSTMLLSDSNGVATVTHVDSGATSHLPLPPAYQVTMTVGWLSASEVMVAAFAVTPHARAEVCAPCLTPTASPPTTLLGVDIATGNARPIATIPSEGMMNTFQFALSPDRTQVFAFDQQFEDQPMTPAAFLIDVRSGALQPLPAIARVTSTGVATLSWRPGTHTLALSAETSSSYNWLVDVWQDTATPLTIPGTVGGWSPDGRVLVTSSGYQSMVGSGPFTLTANILGAGGTPTQTRLTDGAMTFFFLGFVWNS